MKLLTITALSLTLVAMSAAAQDESTRADEISAAQAAGPAKIDLASLPLGFEANHGQTDARVDFVARSEGYTVFLNPSTATISLMGEKAAALRLHMNGAEPRACGEALGAPASHSNYFVGRDSARWVRKAPTHARVRYADAWSGIDIVYHGNGRQLEFDFVVAPGVDPELIRFTLEGEDAVAIGAHGELSILLAGEPLSFEAPVAYQEIAGERREVEAHYRLEGDQVSFELGAYDHARELVIDPVIVYSTYLGGHSIDKIRSVVLDGSGNAYVTGSTTSFTFPVTPGAFDASMSSTDAFIAKISANGSHLLFSTFLGGSGTDAGHDIALADDRIWIVGETKSTNFPALSSTTFMGIRDSFLATLSMDGSQLQSSTFIGTAGDDLVHGLAVESFTVGYNGQMYQAVWAVLGGETTGSFDGIPVSGAKDGFVMIYTSWGTRYWSKTIRGSGEDAVTSVAARDNVVWIAGHTAGGLPDTSGALWVSLDSSHNGGRDGFLTRVKLQINDYEESGMGFSVTSMMAGYLGGSGTDEINAISMDSSGSLYLVGSTTSTNFPIKQLGGLPVFDATHNGGTDGFAAKVQLITGHGLTQVSLRRSTFLGGSGADAAYGVDARHQVLVVGNTGSANYPRAGMSTSLVGGLDAFITRLDPELSATDFSILLGGHGQETARHVSANALGRVAVGGETGSNNFPGTMGAYDWSSNGMIDGFLIVLQQEGVYF